MQKLSKILCSRWEPINLVYEISRSNIVHLRVGVLIDILFFG